MNICYKPRPSPRPNVRPSSFFIQKKRTVVRLVLCELNDSTVRSRLVAIKRYGHTVLFSSYIFLFFTVSVRRSKNWKTKKRRFCNLLFGRALFYTTPPMLHVQEQDGYSSYDYVCRCRGNWQNNCFFPSLPKLHKTLWNTHTNKVYKK